MIFVHKNLFQLWMILGLCSTLWSCGNKKNHGVRSQEVSASSHHNQVVIEDGIQAQTRELVYDGQADQYVSQLPLVLPEGPPEKLIFKVRVSSLGNHEVQKVLWVKEDGGFADLPYTFLYSQMTPGEGEVVLSLENLNQLYENPQIVFILKIEIGKQENKKNLSVTVRKAPQRPVIEFGSFYTQNFLLEDQAVLVREYKVKNPNVFPITLDFKSSKTKAHLFVGYLQHEPAQTPVCQEIVFKEKKTNHILPGDLVVLTKDREEISRVQIPQKSEVVLGLWYAGRQRDFLNAQPRSCRSTQKELDVCQMSFPTELAGCVAEPNGHCPDVTITKNKQVFDVRTEIQGLGLSLWDFLSGIVFYSDLPQESKPILFKGIHEKAFLMGKIDFDASSTDFGLKECQ